MPDGSAGSAWSLGTWNLETFSRDTDDPRTPNLAREIASLAPDVLAVQELTTAGEGGQAFDALVAALPGYAGIHNPWQSWDTTVGLLYRPETVSLRSTEELFADDPLAFPRPPLRADLTVGPFEVTVIVVHLKAYDDGLERRRAACAALDDYVRTALVGVPTILVGDFNDDPNEPAATNAFAGTLLSEDYVVLTGELPAASVTETAYWHEVDGEIVAGTFLDHAIANQAVVDAYPHFTATIDGVDEAGWDAWRALYSDHFPVTFSFAR
jgi:endonuclease/exonuclease/phosphatase family metal-dependent hydrolase